MLRTTLKPMLAKQANAAFDSEAHLFEIKWDGLRRLGLEGIVANRPASPYLPGKRSPYWLKIKPKAEAEPRWRWNRL